MARPVVGTMQGTPKRGNSVGMGSTGTPVPKDWGPHPIPDMGSTSNGGWIRDNSADFRSTADGGWTRANSSDLPPWAPMLQELTRLLRDQEQRIVEAVVRNGRQPELGPPPQEQHRSPPVPPPVSPGAPKKPEWQASTFTSQASFAGTDGLPRQESSRRSPHSGEAPLETPSSCRNLREGAWGDSAHPAAEQPCKSSTKVATSNQDTGSRRSSGSKSTDRRKTCVIAEQEQRLALATKVFDEDQESPPPVVGKSGCRRLARRLVSSRAFALGIPMLIIMNVLVIGVQADWIVKNATATSPVWFRICDILFAIAFCMELAVRLCADGLALYARTNLDRWWNVFDAILVAAQLSEELMKQLMTDAPDLSAMRVLRVLRFIRMARIVRIARVFSDLRVIVAGMLSSMKSLMWAALLLAFLAFMFSVLVLDFVAVNFRAAEMHVGPLPASTARNNEVLLHDWGSVLSGMYTLYKSTSGGLDWGEAAAPLEEVSSFLALAFCVYITISVFCVLNIVTGVFVENSKTMLSKDETQVLISTIDARKKWLEDLRGLWNSFGAPEDVDLETFKKCFQDVRIQILMGRLGIDPGNDADGLFKLLDFDGSGTIELDEFFNGLQMLHGPAKNIDIARILSILESMQRQIKTLQPLGASTQSVKRQLTKLQPSGASTQDGASSGEKRQAKDRIAGADNVRVEDAPAVAPARESVMRPHHDARPGPPRHQPPDDALLEVEDV